MLTSGCWTVWNLNTNQWLPRITLEATAISDLKRVPPPDDPVHSLATPITTGAATPLASKVAQPVASEFQDPAIVTIGRRVGVPHQSATGHGPPNSSQRQEPQPGAAPGSLPVTAPHPLPQVPGPVRETLVPVPVPVVVQEPSISTALDGLTLEQKPSFPTRILARKEEGVIPKFSVQAVQEPQQTKRQRRRRVKNGGSEAVDESTLPSKQGKGWRQTPMLQSTHSFQPFTSLKRRGLKGKAADENGWASEDVTDVQEAGEFNFEDGLRKFDKHTLFEQMRQDDQIDDADRLVSHNRIQRPRPGTNGGRNYHASENVLDAPSPIPKSVRENLEASVDYWNSEADEGVSRNSGRLSSRDQGSRQSSHRRAESKVSTTRRSQSRKASAVSNQPLVIKGSRPSSRLSIPPVVDKKKRSGGNAASPSQGLYLLPSQRQIEPVSALQMLNLENIAHTELGLTEDMMAENAGRGIAEVTLTVLEDPAIKVRLAATANSRSRGSPPPTVVILAGNNKSGIRAVAAGRHLVNKGVNVLVCVMGIERNERELLEDMRHQVQLFRNFGGRIFSKGELFDYMRKASIPTLTIDTPRTALSSMTVPPPVTLIIDALLGLAISFEELRTGDQTACYELIEWANRNEAFVLAIDVPTGIDPSSGKVSIIDGNPLYVKPRYVVCMGAPKRGLLEAIIAGDQDNDEAASGNPALADDSASDWKLFLVDIGFSQAVWKKAGTKIRKGIDFGLQWVVEMRYRGAGACAGAEDEE